MVFQQEIPEYPPRLFLCSNATGRFEVEEIFNFTQEDMDDDDVMLLDTYESIFLWIGQKSNSKEKQEAMKTAVVSEMWYLINSSAAFFLIC